MPFARSRRFGRNVSESCTCPSVAAVTLRRKKVSANDRRHRTIVAWLNQQDQHHSWTRDLTSLRPWITLESCLAEAAWNLKSPRKRAQLVELGLVVVAHLDDEDWQRVAQLAAKFADHDVDLVDFAVVS